MALIALIISTAFAVTFPTSPPPAWCAKPHELELVTYLSPGWPAKLPPKMSATHIKAYDDGEHCLVFSDFSTYMTTAIERLEGGDFLGVILKINDRSTYVEHVSIPSVTELRGGSSGMLSVDKYDWKLDTKTPFAPTTTFGEISDMFVVSGLSESSIVTLTLVHMHPESPDMACLGGLRNGGTEHFECTTVYSRMVIESQQFLGNGTKPVKRSP